MAVVQIAKGTIRELKAWIAADQYLCVPLSSTRVTCQKIPASARRLVGFVVEPLPY